MNDFRYAARLLAKTPGFTVLAVIVLALGIGANTAMFSLVNAMLFQPIASGEPDIVGIFTRDTTRPGSYREFSWTDYEQIRGQRDIFTAVMAHDFTLVGITDGDHTRRVFAAVVSSNYFSTLGVRVEAGRGFAPEEERPGANIAVAIVGHSYLRRNPGVVGKALRINGRSFTVVGATPEGFAGTMALVAPEVWLPAGVFESVASDAVGGDKTSKLSDPSTHALLLVGRLRPGLTAPAAGPQLDALSQRLERTNPAENRHQALSVQKLPRLLVSSSPQTDAGTGAAAALLMGMASIVLLIACLNLANMLLARGSARRREIAVRLALGGTRRRIVRQLLTEGLVLAAVGGAAGLLLAEWATRVLAATLVTMLPMELTYDPTPDARVLAATIALCGLSTLLAALGPAWRATGPDVLPGLKEQPAQSVGGRRLTLRNALVVGQLALSLALLTAAGLFMRGAAKAAVTDPGFSLDGGILASLDPSMAGYDVAKSREAIRTILQHARAVPGVQSASVASLVPFGPFIEDQLVQRAGVAPASPGQRDEGVTSIQTIVGSDYFEALGLPLLRGRGFSAAEEESAGGTRTAVVDEPLARKLFGNDDPLGRRIQFAEERRKRLGQDGLGTYEIVGLVPGIRNQMFDHQPGPHVYLPYGQHFRSAVTVHARTAGPEAAVLARLRDQLRAADPNVPVLSLQTFREFRDSSLILWGINTGARVFSAFGAVALLLAAIGVYGVKAYVVSRRTREIGIRIALGATPRDVLWLVLREGMTLTGVGLAVGLGLAALVAMALSSFLYEVRALDPVVFSVAPLVLCCAAVAAAYLPARRATKVQPIVALRAE